MSTFRIADGQFLTGVIAGNGPVGGGGTPTSLEPGTCSVSLSTADYAKLYVADLGDNPSGPGRVIAFVPRVRGPVGGSYVVTINFSGSDGASGSALNPIGFTCEVDGPAPAPAGAQNFGFFSQELAPLASAPPDPGKSSITF